MREKWEKEFVDIAYLDNDANDYYYEWVELGESSLIELFKQYLIVNGDRVKVKVKVRKGAIFISKI